MGRDIHNISCNYFPIWPFILLFFVGWSFGAAVLSKTHHIEYGGEVSEVVIAVRSGDAYLTVDPVDGGVKLIKKNAVDAVSLHKK